MVNTKALATLMQHLKEVDSENSIVLIVQVKNETGLLGDSQDRSRIANEIFKKPISLEVISHMQSQYGHDVLPSFRKRFLQNPTVGVATWRKRSAKASMQKRCLWQMPSLGIADT